MNRSNIRHLAACTLVIAMGFAASAVASPPIPLPPPDSPQIWPAGTACDFALRIDLSGSKYHLKEFYGKNGDVIRLIVAGRGSLVTLTNMDPDGEGATITLKNYGFSDEITFPTPGTVMDTIRGHFVMINSPREPSAEPFTTYFVGRLVATTDTSTWFATVESFDGKSTDICAALS